MPQGLLVCIHGMLLLDVQRSLFFLRIGRFLRRLPTSKNMKLVYVAPSEHEWQDTSYLDYKV